MESFLEGFEKWARRAEACLDLPGTGDGHARFHVFEARQTRTTTSDLTMPQNPRHVAGPLRSTHIIEDHHWTMSGKLGSRVALCSNHVPVSLRCSPCALFPPSVLVYSVVKKSRTPTGTHDGPRLVQRLETVRTACSVTCIFCRSGDTYGSIGRSKYRLAAGSANCCARCKRARFAVQETACNPAATRKISKGRTSGKRSDPSNNALGVVCASKMPICLQNQYLRGIL